MTSQSTTAGAAIDNRHADETPMTVVPLRHPWRWVATAVIALVVGCFIYSLATNERFQFDVFAKYLTSDAILGGVVRTLQLTVIGMVLATVLGVLLAVMRLSPNPIVSGASSVYIWFFRGVPLLVQLVFWGFIAALYPTISFGVPAGPTFFSFDSNQLLTPFAAAIVALALHEAAYVAEIARSGIISVPKGQIDAASALGMSRPLMMRRIILPQAMRVIIPPLGNETISMLKYTSLVSVIAYHELLYSAQIIYSRTYEVIPLLLVVSFWYLVMVSVLSFFQYLIERRLSRGRATISQNRKGFRAKKSAIPTAATTTTAGTTGATA